MSLEKSNIEKLVERIDDLLIILNKISEDLRSVSASMKSMTVLNTTPVPTPAIPEIRKNKKAIEELRMMFSEDLENLLSFEEKEDYIIVKPRQFLGSGNFAKIASTVRGIGGEYISAGRDSHFRIPKQRI